MRASWSCSSSRRRGRRSPGSLTQSLALLLDRGIDVSFLTSRGRLRGALVSAQSRNVYLRLAQFERFREPAFRLAVSRNVVTAKITAQLRLVIRYQRNHPDRGEADAADRLRQFLSKVGAAEEVPSLQGLEGAAAALYYRQFAAMLTAVGFPGRKKHPSTDPANALLSLGYVIVGNELASLLEARGFDPALGFLHGLRYGRQSLALDLVEAFRQPVVDRLTLRLLNRRQLGPDDFEGGERGLLLKPDSLRTYLAHYEDHLRAPSEGTGSPTWRQRLIDQVDALREMVMSGDPAPLYTWSG